MGFFDFLSAPEQDVETLRKEQAEARKVKEIPQDPKKEMADWWRRDYASRESDLVKREGRAMKRAREILGVGTMMGGGDEAKVRDALAKGLIQNPIQLAADLDVMLEKRKGVPEDRQVQGTQALAELRNELSLLIRDREAFGKVGVPPVQPQSTPEELGKEAEQAAKKADELQREASGMGVLGGEDLNRKVSALRGQAGALQKLSQEGTAKKEAEKPLTFTEENSDPNLPPTSKSPAIDTFKALGVPKEKVVSDMLEILKGVGVNEGEWDDQVPTQAGMKRILSVLDPEGQFAAKLSQDILADQQRTQTQAGIDQEQRKIEGESKALGAQMQQQKSELRELYKSLNSQPFMQSWIGLLAYVILGTLTGPTNAARLLGIGRNRNAIMGEIEAIKEEMRYTSRQQQRQEDMAFQLRRDAISQRQRDLDHTRSRDESLQKMYINHKLILERAKRTSSGTNRQIISKLEGDFNRTLKFMQDSEQIMNNDWLDDKDPKKIRASREYERLKQEAEFIDQKLRSLTEQIQPGTYKSEEEDAAGTP